MKNAIACIFLIVVFAQSAYAADDDEKPEYEWPDSEQFAVDEYQKKLKLRDRLGKQEEQLFRLQPLLESATREAHALVSRFADTSQQNLSSIKDELSTLSDESIWGAPIDSEPTAAFEAITKGLEGAAKKLEGLADGILELADSHLMSFITSVNIDELIAQGHFSEISEFLYDNREKFEAYDLSALEGLKKDFKEPLTKLRNQDLIENVVKTWSFDDNLTDLRQQVIDWVDSWTAELKPAEAVFKDTLDRISKSHEQTNNLITARISELESRRKGLKDELNSLDKHILNLKKKGASMFESINYMMLLLAFSFGLTLILRAYRDDLPIITDQTLVEYGGLVFLLLAVVILASGEKIDSSTVGPILGIIAGYIFGKNVAFTRLKAESRETESEKSTGRKANDKRDAQQIAEVKSPPSSAAP